MQNLFTELQKKHVEESQKFDEAQNAENEERKKMSTEFQEKIAEIQNRLQAQYQDKEQLSEVNAKLRKDL